MALSFKGSRSHAERGLAWQYAQRSSLLDRDSAPSPSASTASSPSKPSPVGVTLPPNGIAALIGIVVVLCVFVLGFGGWRIWVWKRSKKANELPGLFSLVDDASTMNRSMSMSQSSSVVRVTLPTDVKAAITRDHFLGTFQGNLNYQPKVVYSDPREKTKDINAIPEISVTPPALQITPPPTYAEIPTSILSPRSASRVHSTVPIAPSPTLPRLLVVECTFTATLHDELEIREGETLRLLEEYEDEWCLVQRVGPSNSEIGVIPRFCIVDKPDGS